MTDPQAPTRSLADLLAKPAPPASVGILTKWINHAERSLGIPAAGGRMGWLVASTVVIAALQRAVDATGTPRFLLKGGTLLQHRLGNSARATSDVDGLVRGDLDTFMAALDEALAEPWGPLTLARSEVEVIATPTRVIQPRRLNIFVSLRGQRWRKVQVELAPDEGDAGATPEAVPAPTLGPFGLPTPDALATMAMRYQIAEAPRGQRPSRPPGVDQRPAPGTSSTSFFSTVSSRKKERPPAHRSGRPAPQSSMPGPPTVPSSVGLSAHGRRRSWLTRTGPGTTRAPRPTPILRSRCRMLLPT